MTGRKARWVVVIAALAAGVAIACGGSDGGSGTQSPGVGSPTASPSPTPVPTAGPNASPLERLAAGYLQGVDGKVVYRYLGINWGEHPDGTWTVYRDGENRREDWTNQAAGFPATTIAIHRQDANYVCTDAQVLKQCYAQQEKDLQLVFVLFTPVHEVFEAILRGIEGLQVTELPPETIAGVSAQCFDLNVPGRIGVGPPGTEKIKTCFSQEGALLYLKRIVTFKNPDQPVAELTAEAQEVGPTAPSDFEPIVPPQS